MKGKSLLLVAVMAFASLFSNAQSGVPGSWSKEDVIVLEHAATFSHLLAEKGKNYTSKQALSIRIEVSNKGGVDVLKHFYVPADIDFKLTAGENGFDERDAKDFKGIVPEFFAQLFPDANEFKKLYLADLANKDIIDFSAETTETVPTKDVAVAACNVLGSYKYALAMNYPVASRTITLDISGEMHLNFGSLNNGPLLDDLGSDGEEESNVVRHFEVNQSNIEKMSGSSFVYPMRSYPSVKLEVLLCQKGKSEGSGMIAGEVGEAFDEWDEELIKAVMFEKNNAWNSNYKKLYKEYTTFTGEMKPARTADKLLEAHYRQLQGFVFAANGIPNYSDADFIGLMMAVLNENGMPFQVVVGFDKTSCYGDEMILNSDLRYGLKVTDTKGDYYVFPVTKYGTWNDVDSKLSGTEGFAFTAGKKVEDSKLDYITMPTAEPAWNQTVIRRNLSFDQYIEATVVNEKVQFKGSSKGCVGYKIITDEEYNDAILSRTQKTDFAGKIVTGNKKEQEDARDAFVSDLIKAQYDSVQIDKVLESETGVDEKNEWLAYKAKYRVANLIRFDLKDSLYYFNLGAFVSPVIPSTASIQRSEDIHFGSPQIFDSKIVLQTDAGVNVFGA
ncbi:MAG: hypothetical protein KDC92_13440, partial [Bacteroidetes bacterium]|nr:hypothetical protein [Bacteroidota bacterium]